jgi:outer membrane protein OmpA-like peptidoglycan-associated protein
MAYGQQEPDLMVGLSTEGGLLNVNTKTLGEVDKTGMIFGLKGFAEIPYGFNLFHVGLGLDYASASGKDNKVKVKQAHKTTSGFLETAWFLNFGKSYMPGLELRAFSGPGANFSVPDKKKNSMLYEVGPGVRFALPKISDKVDLMGQLTWLMSLQNKDRSISNLLVGIGFSYPIHLSKKSTIDPPPPPVIQPEPPKVEAPVAPPPKFVANLGAGSLQFEKGSAKPDKASLERLIKLAQELVENEQNWTTLEIFGHTDATGKKEKNLQLSKDRANSVKSILTEHGVPMTKIKNAEGFGDTRLLPALSPVAPDHRRVELSFDGVENVESFNGLLESIFGKMKQ